MPPHPAGLLLLLLLAPASPAGAHRVGEPYDDASLERSGRARIDRDPALSALPIRLRVRSGVARLEGEVETLEQAESARRAVAQVRGLVDLESALAVPPALVGDTRLSEDLERSLERYPRLRDLDLAWSVEQGAARVEGSVSTAGERRLLLEAARAVRGLRAVDLRVEVKEGGGQEDAAVERQVRGLLSDRVRFPFQGKVQVRVRDGAAILEGSVPRVIDRLEAEEVTWFAGGVRGVQNLIRVVPRPRLHRVAAEEEESGEEEAPRPLRPDPESPEEPEAEGSENADD